VSGGAQTNGRGVEVEVGTGVAIGVAVGVTFTPEYGVPM
jgi:hypothetical protein